MIKKPNNWESVTASAGAYVREKLPAGGYEAKILKATVTPNRDGSESLIIMLDITSGEYAGFFKRDFDTNPYENKRWRGVYRQRLPENDNSKSTAYFKAMTEAVEKSNKGYKWDWNENSLKGKAVGMLVRDKEYDFDGKHGFAAEIFALTDVKTIREGNFKTPEPKYLQHESFQGAPDNFAIPPEPPILTNGNGDDDGYPF